MGEPKERNGAQHKQPETSDFGLPTFLDREEPEVRERIRALVEETRRAREETDQFVWEVARRRGLFGISTST